MNNVDLKNKPKLVRNIKAARRLLSKLIYDIQAEDISNEKAKLLIYALIKFSELVKNQTVEELELRIKKLEEALNGKKS